MGHVHTKSNSYALTRVTDQIIWMSLSGVCLECRMRIQPYVPPSGPKKSVYINTSQSTSTHSCKY